MQYAQFDQFAKFFNINVNVSDSWLYYSCLYTHVGILYARSLLERDKGMRVVTRGFEDCFNIRVGGNRTADGYGKKLILIDLWPNYSQTILLPRAIFHICLLNALVVWTQPWSPAFAKSTPCFINLSIRTSNIELFSTHPHSFVSLSLRHL